MRFYSFYGFGIFLVLYGQSTLNSMDLLNTVSLLDKLTQIELLFILKVDLLKHKMRKEENYKEDLKAA